MHGIHEFSEIVSGILYNCLVLKGGNPRADRSAHLSRLSSVWWEELNLTSVNELWLLYYKLEDLSHSSVFLRVLGAGNLRSGYWHGQVFLRI